MDARYLKKIYSLSYLMMQHKKHMLRAQRHIQNYLKMLENTVQL